MLNHVRKILLINPDSRPIYEGSVVEDISPSYPPLNLALIAAVLLQNKYNVKVLDLNIENDQNAFDKILKDYAPDMVGITFKTPHFDTVKNYLKRIKDFNDTIITVIGGIHATSMPKECLDEMDCDICVVGEGENTIIELLNNELSDVSNIAFKNNKSEIIINQRSMNVSSMDELPIPAWQLFDLSKYNSPSVVSKRSPVGFIESSRGCMFGCSYCNKNVFGQSFRVKSIGRFLDEMKYMKKIGFNELYVVDDGFTTDVIRAKEICKRIIEEQLDIVWTLTNGIRVDKVDEELFPLLRKAGCYQVAFGIESGNQVVLNKFGKGTKIEQVPKAVKLARKAGIDTIGYFIIGLPDDTEETIKETISFSKKIDLDLAKFNILIPYPGTRLFRSWDSKNLIISKEWQHYNRYKPSQIFNHPNLSWDTIYSYQEKAFRSFYFRPSFVVRRILKGIKNNTIFDDLKVFVKTEW